MSADSTRACFESCTIAYWSMETKHQCLIVKCSAVTLSGVVAKYCNDVK